MILDPEYFPTPIGIAKKMVLPYMKNIKRNKFFNDNSDYRTISSRIILEPSAGSGSLLDGIINDTIPIRDKDGKWNEYHQTDKIELYDCQIYCIEKDPDMRHILQQKNYKVIADDFLEYNGDYLFDLIIMNPPFSNGDEHLLKAWKILHEGDIVCLLNSETINNPYTEKRKLLQKIIQDYGSVEELGQVFKNSERPTDVNVSMVRLHKLSNAKLNFEFEEVNQEKSFSINESNITDAPAIRDIIGNMLIQYEQVKNTFVEYMKIAEKLDFYGQSLIKKRDYIKEQTDIFQLAHKCYKDEKTKKKAFNVFCDGMKQNMWQLIFDNLNNISSVDMEKFMTHSVRKNYSEFVQKQGQMDFTRENVWNIITMLFENKKNILERSIMEVFEIFTKYHADNRVHIEGWKTNDAYKVNRKVIIPYAIEYGKYASAYNLKMYGDNFSISYNTRSEYSDIDKAMAYICGDIYYQSFYQALDSKLTKIGTIKIGDKFDNTCFSTYFDIKFWKKGTLHLTFRSEKLWEQFNIRACWQKQWLRPGVDFDGKPCDEKGIRLELLEHKPKETLMINAVNKEEGQLQLL